MQQLAIKQIEKLRKMNRDLIVSVLNGYENQLLNAEIKCDKKNIEFLKIEINNAKIALSTMAEY